VNTSQSVQITDTAGNMHTIEITSTGIILDGKPCQIKVKETRIAVLSGDPARGIITVAPAAFWHAFAGGDPTPDNAGLLLAQALAHWAAMQEIPLVLQRLHHLVDDIDRQLHHFSEAPLPAYCFDPFILQLLRTYDGTEEHIAALARLLKQPPETIHTWLTTVGLTDKADHEDREPSLPATASAIPGPDGTPAPVLEQPRTCRWTPVMIQQLTTAFFASDEPSISAVSRAIAGKYGWPVERVEYKIYQQGLPRQREQQRHQQDIKTSAEQEEDQPVIPVEVDTSAPIETSAEQEEGQTEEAARVKAHVSEPEDGSNHLPASLSSGNFLWDVKIDGKLQRWPLDVAYGMFPFSRPGTPLVYREQQYVLQQVGTSVIAVTPVGAASAATVGMQERRTAMQVATV